MSKVILCTGKKAEKPYVLKTSGVKLYTIEELCYALKDNLDLLDAGVIDLEMARFISKELGLPERGEMLERLIKTRKDLVSRLVVVFCSCDYFDEVEIRKICEELDALSQLPPVGRMKLRADKYMKQGFVAMAVREYRSILSSAEAGMLSDKEYGGVLHNLGVVEAWNGFYESAAHLFLEAYERNNEEESLKSYLFALKLNRKESTYLNEAMRLLDSSDLTDKMERELELLQENLMQSGQLDDINRLKLLQQQGRASEYERLSGEIIGGLKRSYRLAQND